MIPIKSLEEIEKMRHAGAVSAAVLEEVCNHITAGISTAELDNFAKEVMERYGVRSATFGFRSGKRVFPGYGCWSINDEIVHGLPSEKKVLQDGDIISVDLAMHVDGFVGDNTRTVAIGAIKLEVQHLIDMTYEALLAGINAARPGNTVGHISAAIQRYGDENRLGIVRELVGHGIGREMHEDPQVPNYGVAGQGPVLKSGMTLAIEPMFTLGSEKVSTNPDGWTIRTVDGSWAAHWEHTVLITDSLPEILTLLKK
ncbi:MAG: type I methionyl aminopeptidase [Puniceicoccales bacterium]|jgi:methionyl aminopeptidase|nr:type I methionyl aminopeptidase [Puniceicoccales bacterium]